MAVQLASLGLHQQAEDHYRRAYELMPDSFGRVESHCFGCEGVTGPKAQSIAEKVFSGLATKTPDKPQVHYLLGYLREEQGRYRDALASYRKAVSLDPDYLNAWTKLSGLAERMSLPRADREAVVLNLLRLDPLSRHSHPDVSGVTDLRKLWEASVAAAKFHLPVPKELYPLAASKASIEKEREKLKGSPMHEGFHQTFDAFEELQRLEGPGFVRRQNPGARLRVPTHRSDGCQLGNRLVIPLSPRRRTENPFAFLLYPEFTKLFGGSRPAAPICFQT